MTSKRTPADYQEGKKSADEVARTFATLAEATRALAQCSDALVSIPRSTADELEAAVAEEQDRIHPALPEFIAFAQQVLDSSERWGAEQDHYDAVRSKGRVAKALHIPPVEMHLVERTLRGIRVPFKPSMRTHPKPQQRPLADAEEDRLRRLVAATSELSSSVFAEVEAGGSVLLGPAQLVAAGPEEMAGES